MVNYQQNELKLRELMDKAGITSLGELSIRSGVSQRDLFRIVYGLIAKLQLEKVVKLAETLNISVADLLKIFWQDSENYQVLDSSENLETINQLKKDYQLLEKQQDNLYLEFQQTVLDLIESWLLQWPTVVAKVKQNPQLPAANIIPIMKPLEKLLQAWNLETIAVVEEEIPYDPQLHELIEGAAEKGDLVKVRYVGYRQGEKLLYRAKVNSVAEY